MSEESEDSSTFGTVDDDIDAGELRRLRLSSDRPPPPPPPLCVLRAHAGEVQAVALSPCGTLLYSGDSEGLLRAWDVEQRRPAGEATRLHPSDGGVLGLYVAIDRSMERGGERFRESPLPLLLLSQGREGTLKLWKLGDEGRRVVETDSGRSSSAPNPSPPSSCLPRPLVTTVTGSKGFCVLSAVEDPEAEAEVEGGEDEGEKEKGDDEWRPSPLYAAVASEDAASVRVFDARRGGEPLCELSEAEAAAAAQSPSSASAEAPKSRGMAMAVALFFVGAPSSLELFALVGYEDGSVVLWRCLKEKGDGRKGRRRRTREREMAPAVEALSSLRIHFDAVTAVAGPVSFPGEAGDDGAGDCSPSPPALVLRFFSGGADSVLASYEVRVEGEGEEGIDESDEEKKRRRKKASITLCTGPAAKLPARGVGALAVSQREDETLIAVGGWDGAIRLLALQRESENDGEGCGGDDGDDGGDSTSAAAPRRFFLEPLGELEHHVAPVASMSFCTSVEGELLASGGRDGSIALWAGLV